MRRQKLEYGAYVLALTGALTGAARARLSDQAQKLCRRFIDDRRISSWETYADRTRDTLASALQRLNESARVARR